MQIFRCIFILFLLFIPLFSSVKIKLPQSLIKGEPLIFTIVLTGKIEEFPDLKEIDGFQVQKIRNSSYTKNINGNIKKSVEYTYSLYPNRDLIFPSLSFKLDSKVYKTEEKKILIKLPSKTQSDLFDLEISTNKNEVFIGEKFILKMKFKYKDNGEVANLSFAGPQFKNFWFTQLDKSKKYKENRYIVFETDFLVSALKEGLQKIDPFVMEAQVFDFNNNDFSFFANTTKSINIYSNDIDIRVKTLPTDISLIGDFNISSTVDKKEISKGEAISYNLEIKGSGNFEDIEDIKLDIPNSTIYENKPEIKTLYKDGKLNGIYKKTFSILPNENLIIPRIELKYYDKKLNEVITKRTDKFEIKLKKLNIEKEISKLEKSKKIVDTNEIKTEKIVVKASSKEKVLFFILGTIFAFVSLFIYLFIKKQRVSKKVENLNIIRKIKLAKNKNELMKKILPYLGKDKNLDNLIFSIEKLNEFDLAKKEIIKVLKEIEKGKI